MSLPVAFWDKTRRTDCIIWTGAVNNKGYGCFGVNGVSKLAHRVAWEDVHGPIPDGLTIDHLCRVRNCVNVRHMELVTSRENTLRQPRILRIGGECRNGHLIESRYDIYIGPNGRKECRACRRVQADRRVPA